MIDKISNVVIYNKNVTDIIPKLHDLASGSSREDPPISKYRHTAYSLQNGSAKIITTKMLLKCHALTERTRGDI
jgi:hypothetical protein